MPTKVITIDSDEEEDPDVSKRALTKNEMDFFSTLKIKPNELNQEQTEQFDILAGCKVPLSERKTNALHSLVDRLRGFHNKSAARLRLIDYYRRQKGKQVRTKGIKERYKYRQGVRRIISGNLLTNKQEEPNKENWKDTAAKGADPLQRDKYQVLRSANQKSKSSNDAAEDNAVNGNDDAEPNNVSNGLYRVVENSIVDKRQDNKIVMKIAKPVEIKESKINGLTEHSLLLDGYSPARDIPAIDDHMVAKCNLVKLKCKNLPQNPLHWTKFHVAEFINAADCGKHARIFLDEVGLFVRLYFRVDEIELNALDTGQTA